MYLKRIEAAVLIALIITMAISITGFAQNCSEIRDSVLRLHVIANSDSKEDQALKLKVRDAVLKAGKQAFSGADNVIDAQQKIEDSRDKLKQAALKVIKEEGYNYSVKIVIGKEYFNTRTYDNITFPAGQYRAVRIIIGKGEGHNWWCVMFPPLCVPGASKTEEVDALLNKKGAKIVKSSPKVEVRFKVVEVYEKISDTVKNK